MKSKDLKLENNDFFIDPVKGDFLITDSDTQHVQDIINSFANWWKEHKYEFVQEMGKADTKYIHNRNTDITY